jgi:hypothetical protein
MERPMRPQPLIAVSDVEASSRWYQRLEHHHGPIGNPADRPYVNGVLLWFEIDDFDAAMVRVAEMKPEIVIPRHRNPPGEGGPNHWECWLCDPDGYTVVLASPDGSPDGAWRPVDASSAQR